jgi:hypothetical protein
MLSQSQTARASTRGDARTPPPDCCRHFAGNVRSWAGLSLGCLMILGGCESDKARTPDAASKAVSVTQVTPADSSAVPSITPVITPSGETAKAGVRTGTNTADRYADISGTGLSPRYYGDLPRG